MRLTPSLQDEGTQLGYGLLLFEQFADSQEGLTLELQALSEELEHEYPEHWILTLHIAAGMPTRLQLHWEW